GGAAPPKRTMISCAAGRESEASLPVNTTLWSEKILGEACVDMEGRECCAIFMDGSGCEV
ncbi:MAG: hypothetical protein AAB354_15920, partial [candidate division KSB1 bacterium]